MYYVTCNMELTFGLFYISSRVYNKTQK